MRVNGKAILGLAALGFTLSAAPASAVTRCANPAGTAPCLKFQDAIDASGPGDTVTVYAGTYTETALDPLGYIEVGYGKDGLKIVGSGVVVIDIEFGTGNTSNSTIYVDSSFVSISNITIRNGGTGIDSYWNTGLALTNVKVLGADYHCFLFDSSDFASVKTSKCIGSGGSGIYSTDSDYLTATGNTFAQVDYGLELYTGNSPNVSSNVVFNTFANPIYVSGCCSDNYGGTFKTNNIYNAYFEGIYIENQHGVNVSSNKITNTDGTGIYLYYSENPIVASNIITNADFTGIEVYGSAAQIKSNTINNTSGEGIYLAAGNTDADSAVISLNKITAYPGGNGIENYYGNHVTISSNTISNVSYGILTYDSMPRILSNTITNTQSTGIYVYANACYGGVVQLNKVNNVGGGSNGFEVYCQNAYGPLSLLSNTVTRANNDCFYLNGLVVSGTTSINAVGNKGYDCGYYGGSGRGFSIIGTSGNSGLNLSGNLVQRVAGDGYFVYAPGTVVLTANTADSATEDGFDVHTGNVTLTNNKATNNTGVGFEFNHYDDFALAPLNGATLTLTGNVATGNAGGACIASGMTSPPTGAGNTFGTPATPLYCDESSGYIGN